MLQNLINQEVSLWTGFRFRYKLDAVSLPVSLSLDYRGLFETTTWTLDPVLLTCSGNVADLFPTYPLTTWLWMDNTRHSIIVDLRLKKKHLTDSLYPKAVLKTRADWSKQKLSMWGISPALKDSSCAAESHLRLFFFRQLGGLLSGAFTDSPGMWGNWVANTKGVPVVDWSLSVIIFCMW